MRWRRGDHEGDLAPKDPKQLLAFHCQAPNSLVAALLLPRHRFDIGHFRKHCSRTSEYNVQPCATLGLYNTRDLRRCLSSIICSSLGAGLLRTPYLGLSS
jgi:hypothetical protein